MNCPGCGEAVRPGQRFCASCGTRLDRACASCEAPLPEGARFCPECGAPVAEAPAGSTARSEPRHDETAVARKRVSVLFVDLVGFTELARRLDPEETREFQASFFAAAREIVERYAGSVEKFVGDAVMAVWGAPAATEDDAERAVRAALDVVGAVAALPAPPGAAAAHARAAVTTGEVAVAQGQEGNVLVSGEPVNLAARLQAVADPGSVLVDDLTRRATEAAIAFSAAGEQSLKGFPEPVAAWRAARVVGGRRGTGRSDEPEPPFTGRSGELALLKELFHATARERRLRVASITGQAGIGKSRLAWELGKYADGIGDDVYWHQGRSPAYGEGITFWALGEMVRRRAGVLEDDDAAITTRKVDAMLDTFVADAAERMRVRRAIGVLLATDPGVVGERGELFGAWRTLFERIAEHAPVVLVFEDLHWADPGLVEFIGHLLDWSRQHAIFVVTLARPELVDRFPTWGAGQRNFTSIHLEPLPDAEMRDLLSGLVPGLTASTIRAILRRAEGVPLYAVETVRMLVSDGTLVREGDAYGVTRPIEDVSVPATLHALVAARIDGLPAAERSVLRQASILGSSFTLDALAAVSGQPGTDLLPAIERLAAREILRLESDPRAPERGQYQFVQAVIREVAYAGLSRKDRKDRHLAAARFFEARGDEELAGALARHYVEAWRSTGSGPDADALAAQARVALRAAADRAIRLHSYEQARAFLRLALDVSGDDAERASTLERAAEAAWHTARHPEADELLHEALVLYEGMRDALAVARVELGIGVQHNSQGRSRSAVELLTSARSRVPDAGDEAERVAAAIDAELARAHFLVGDHVRAIAVADAAIAAAERLDVRQTLVDALITRGSAIAYGRPREGQAILLGSIALADRYALARQGLRARSNLQLFLDYEDPTAAARLEEDTLALAEQLGRREEVLWALAGRVDRLVWVGDAADAREIVDDTLADDTSPELVRYFMSLTACAIAALDDDPPGLARHLERAEAIASRLTSGEFVANLEYARAVAALLADDVGAAVRSFEAWEATSYADAPGHVLSGLALVRAGRVHDARGRLEAARRAPERGAVVDAAVRTLEAAIAAADGDPGAVAGFTEAIAAWRELGLGLWVALSQLELVRLVGSREPAVAAAADELRRTCEEKGWRALLAQLDASSARAAPRAIADTPTGTEVSVSRP